MPVVTAAVLSVGAAITLGTAASIATAVVSVSIAVGVAGLAVTAVGAITGNKDLLKAGEIMGYVGLAGGLAGGLIGGVGGLAAGTGFLEGAAGAYTGAAGFMQQGWDKGIGSLFQPTVGAQVAGPVGATTGGAAQGIPVSPGALSSATGADIAGATVQGGTLGAPAQALAPGAQSLANASSTIAGANVPALSTPAAGLINAPVAAQVAAPAVPTAIDYGSQFLKGTGSAVAGAGSPASSGALNAFTGMPDWMKYSVMTSGMQALSGAAAGWFQGASAEERLEFEKLVNAQRQGQVDLTNTRGGYAPNLNFTPRPGPAGLINTAGA